MNLPLMHSAQVTKSSNAGFTPRDLDRRKFQEAAAQAIDRQAAAIQQTREYMADLSTRSDESLTLAKLADASLDTLWRVVREHCDREADHADRLRKSLWDRLRWLLTGR